MDSSHAEVTDRNSLDASAESSERECTEHDQLAILTQRIVLIALVLGIGSRVLRYLLRFPLWGDECMLAANFATRSPVGLMSPLDYGQVAPIGFTELVWCFTRLSGFHEWSLRVVSLVAGIVGLIAMWRFAKRSLPTLSAMFAVTLLATSYYPIRHAVEVKPYALDLAWGILLLLVADSWRRAPQRIRWLILLAILTILAQFSSFTATFVAGGICIGLATQAFLRRSWGQVISVGLYGVVLVAGFVGVYWLSATDQFAAHGSKMQDYWQESFPPSPFSHPMAWIVWIIDAHTGEMFAYPVGGNAGGSTLTLVLSFCGVIQFSQRKEWWFLATCAGTFGLGYLASVMHRYPYGNTARLVQHLAPLICLLAGSGIAFLIEGVKTMHMRYSLVRMVASGMFLIIICSSIVDVVRPYKSRIDFIHRDLARWFWEPGREKGEMYCIRTDLGHNFWPVSWQERYVAYQHLYSPKHPPGKPVIRVVDLPNDQQVNIVVYSTEGDPHSGKEWDQWWSEMTERFTYVETDDHRVLIDEFGRNQVWGHYRVYRFAPKKLPLAEQESTN